MTRISPISESKNLVENFDQSVKAKSKVLIDNLCANILLLIIEIYRGGDSFVDTIVCAELL